MYKLVLYVCLSLLGIAFLLSLFGVLSFNPFALLFSTIFITFICWMTNELCAKIFKSPTNVESVYITALILALIISPIHSAWDTNFFSLAIWASIWAMASKYIFAIGNKHLFNPAGFAVALTALTINQSASWWVGTLTMMPFALVGGLLIVKKIRRFDFMYAFFAVTLTSIIGSALLRHVNPFTQISRTFIETPIFFFAFVMLTEPLTTPPTKWLQIAYGSIVGMLYAPWVHFGSLYTTPELALVFGNVFSYAVSPKQKFVMNLKECVSVAENTYDFIFHPEKPLSYRPGQYMEWTLEHDRPDGRGNRRYFTLASSPTESDLRMGIKFYPNGSTFKKALAAMTTKDRIVSAQLAGDFVLPTDPKQKLVFIAGGIGVTPFRSMVKYLIDKKEKRDVVLFYSNKLVSDVAYADVFNTAEKELGIKTIYALSEASAVPKDWKGKVGFIDGKMIATEVPDYKERSFFLSGPHGMVTAFQTTLQQMGVPSSHIKTDFFPGFA